MHNQQATVIYVYHILTYFKVGHYDIKGNDMVCNEDSKERNCNQIRVRNSLHAMVLCETYGNSCQGFVFEDETGRLFLKNNVAKETVFDKHLLLYVKKIFKQKLKPSLGQQQCAVPVASFQDLLNSRCILPVLDPFNKHIMKFVNKDVTQIQCPGKHYTTYKNGVLSLIEQGMFFLGIDCLIFISNFDLKIFNKKKLAIKTLLRRFDVIRTYSIIK